MTQNINDNPYNNKLQIRARLLSAIVNLQNNSQNSEFINQEMADLSKIQDKEAILEILKKEFLKENSDSKDYTITFILRYLVDQEKIEKSLFEDLANPKINDNLKAKIVNFLRELGKHVNYEQYINYFENPDDIIDADTTRLLENAKINPEAQIDFLDFLSALPAKEQEMLIDSLTEDYDGDNLTNILIPVIMSNPYSTLAQSAIKAIGESKSNLAYPVLMWLSENIEDLNVKAAVQKSLSLLKLSGIKTDITEEYYRKILSHSPVYKCFVNYPDGHGNVGLIFSRKTENDFIQMFALVLNDVDGIIDCFGFNEISDGEFERIVNKFYQNNKVIEAQPSFCKYLMENAEKITRLKYEEVSYEYIAWKTITNDIASEHIDLRSGLEKIQLNDFLIKETARQGYFDKWFFEAGDNDAFTKMVDYFENNKISDINTIEQEIEKNKNVIFSQTEISLLNNRLLLCAFLAKTDEEKIDAGVLFSLIDNSDEKNKFLDLYIKKSVYQYFLARKDKYTSLKNATSIFARKSSKELGEIDIKYIDGCIKTIEANWI